MDVFKKASVLLAILSIFIGVALLGTRVTSPTTVVGREGSDVNISFPNAASYVFVYFWGPTSRFASYWDGNLTITTTGPRPNVSFVGNLYKHQYVFMLRNLTAQDAGRYVCSESPHSPDPEISGCVVNLKVRERPGKPYVTRRSLIPEQGHAAHYHCNPTSTADTHLLQYVWRLAGVFQHRGHGDPMLTLKPSMDDLGKLLTCQVVDGDLESPESWPMWLNVLCHQYVDETPIYVILPNVRSPSIPIPNPKPNGSLSLHDPRCQSVGNFTPEDHHAELGADSPFQATLSVSHHVLLHLPSPQPNHTGFYSCSHSGQKDFIPHCGFSIYVLEDELPTPTLGQVKSEDPERLAKVQCDLDWRPTFMDVTLKYYFEVQNGPLLVNDHPTVTVDVDHKVARVRCRAAVGHVFSNFSDFIQVGAHASNFSIRFNVSSPLEVEEGHKGPLSVACTPSCLPRCHAHWKYTGSSGHVTFPGPTLTLRDVTREDAGLYQCSVYGQPGFPSSQLSRSLEVIVTYPPSIKSFTIDGEPWKRVTVNESVTLTCEGEGLEPPMVVMQTRAGAPPPTRVTSDEGSVTWQLDHVQCGHGGDYVCLLYDLQAHPQSPPVEVKKVTLEVTCPPQLDQGQPSFQRFYVEPGQPFHTTVRVTGFPLPSFQLFKLKARWNTDVPPDQDPPVSDHSLFFKDRSDVNLNEDDQPDTWWDEDMVLPEEETKGKYRFGSVHSDPVHPSSPPPGGRSRRDARSDPFGKEQRGSPGIYVEDRFFRDPTVFSDWSPSEGENPDLGSKAGSKSQGQRQRGFNQEEAQARRRTTRHSSQDLPEADDRTRTFKEPLRPMHLRDSPSRLGGRSDPPFGYTVAPSTEPPTSKGDTGNVEDVQTGHPFDPALAEPVESKAGPRRFGTNHRTLSQKGKGSEGKARGLETDYRTLSQKGKGSEGKARGLGTDNSPPSSFTKRSKGGRDEMFNIPKGLLQTSSEDSEGGDNTADWRYPSVLEKQWTRLQAQGQLLSEPPDPPGVDWLAAGHVISPRLELHDPQLLLTLHPACTGSLNLTFDRFKDEDYGVYGVSFWSSLGQGLALVLLQRRGPPDQPWGVSCQTVSPRALDVGWLPGLDNGDDVTAYYIDIYNRTDLGASHDVKDYDVIKVTWDLDKRARMWHEISGLQPDTEYVISVFAQNVHGLTPATAAVHCRTDAEPDAAARHKHVAFMFLTMIIVSVCTIVVLVALIFKVKKVAKCCLKLCRVCQSQGARFALLLPLLATAAKVCVPALEKVSCSLRQRWLQKHADLLVVENQNDAIELGPIAGAAQ